MTAGAKQLLIELADEYEKSGRNDFVYLPYMKYPKSVLDELECDGCITRKHDVVGSMYLTDFGYKEARS